MMAFLSGLFARGEPVLSEAGPPDAAAIAALHGKSFHRGWSDGEIENMLLDRAVLAHRAMLSGSLVGFILSRVVVDEAEFLDPLSRPLEKGDRFRQSPRLVVRRSEIRKI